MIRNSRRVVALAIAGAFVIAPAVSGCGAGTDAQTAIPDRLTEGVHASTDSGVMIRNLFVLGPAPGQRLPAGTAAPVHGVIINGSKDRQADKLVAVTSTSFRQGARLPGGGITLPLDQPVSLSTPIKPAPASEATPGAKKNRGAGATPTATATPSPTATPTATPTAGTATATPAGNATKTPKGDSPAKADPNGPPVVLDGSTGNLFGGETVEVVLQFQRGGSITVRVPVVPRTGEFGTYAPAPGTSPEPAATPTGSSTATPAGGATPHTGATPEGAASGSPGH